VGYLLGEQWELADEKRWPEFCRRMTDAMIRLEAATRPFLSDYRAGKKPELDRAGA